LKSLPEPNQIESSRFSALAAWLLPWSVLERVRGMAEGQSFFEIPADDDLLLHWRDAFSRWEELFPG